MGRITEQKFFQRGNADGQQAHEKMLSIINHQGNTIKTTVNHPHSCHNG